MPRLPSCWPSSNSVAAAHDTIDHAVAAQAIDRGVDPGYQAGGRRFPGKTDVEGFGIERAPRGLFELKFFFNSAIKREGRGDIASESVKQAIKKIIDAEDDQNPYSDQKIVEMLRESHDVKIARRTVAKYREMLGILSSSKRKKYF